MGRSYRRDGSLRDSIGKMPAATGTSIAKMPMLSRIALVVIGALAGLAAIVLSAFFIYRWSHSGEVLGVVVVGSAQVGGLSEIEATAEVLAVEDELVSTPSTVRVNGSDFELLPHTVAFEVDESSIVSSAMLIGREGGLGSQFTWWLTSFGETFSLPLVGSLNEEALHVLLDQWEVDSGMELPFDGAITLEGATPFVQYPRPGLGIDRPGVPQQILGTLLQHERRPVVLPTNVLEPALTQQDLDQSLAHARKLLSGPVTLTRDDPEVSVTFSTEQLAQSFVATIIHGPNPRMQLGFDVTAIDSYLNAIREDLEAPPRNAEFVVDEDDRIRILPSRPGTLVDSGLAAEAVTDAAGTFARLGEFPFEDGAEPEVTTASLERLGIEHLVSAFTTYHSCCQCRVNNIHLIADEIDGALVLPGETFSVNEHVGPRTTAEGYCEAGTIIGGELEDTVGGGVSQFATTFYNAVFWGGYEDIEHKPHSLYFSRYPEGIEGTISWPAPNLIFRNDTDSGVLIKTDYTDTSITVKFFGFNGGRIVVGEQKGGDTILRVVAPGSDARIVTAELSERYNFRDSKTKYEADPTLAPGEEVVETRGGRGWSVDVARTIRYPDGTEVQNFWTVRYGPPFRVILVHPCMVPEGHEGYTGEECPEETTTVPETSIPPTTVPPTTTEG